MSAKAKQARDEWETKLIGSKESLMQMSQVTPVVKRSVTKKLAELDSIWANLQTSHSVSCRHAAIGLGSSESRAYLREISRLRDEGDAAAETALGEEDPDELTVRRLKRSISILQSEVSFAIPIIQSFADESEALRMEAYQQTLNLLEGAEDKLGRYVELSADAEDLLDTTQANALNKKTSDSHKEHGSKLMVLRGEIAKKAPKEKEPKPIVKGNWGSICQSC